MTMPQFSVVDPLDDCEALVRWALGSVPLQTIEDSEFVDGSEDATLEASRSSNDIRVVVIGRLVARIGVT